MSDSESPPDDGKAGFKNEHVSDPGTTIAGGGDRHIDLLQKLLEEQLISPAQGQLALADQEVTGMTLEEVILARGWVTESKLDEVAPWRRKRASLEQPLRVTAGSKNYQQNLKQYRKLMEKILGVSWD